MTEAVVIAVVVNACITMGVVIKEYFRYKAKKNDKNDTDKIIQDAVKKQMGFNPHVPGTSPKCIEHGERLAEVKADIENIENRLDRIEGILNGTYRK